MVVDANEILPRLWLGTVASCDAVQGRGFYRINCLETPHTEDNRCNHCRLLDADGKVGEADLASVAFVIDHAWLNPRYVAVLVHCGQGVERSPLALSYWLKERFRITWDQAYDWIIQRRPVVQDRRIWLRR
jgi:hypothetical protein